MSTEPVSLQKRTGHLIKYFISSQGTGSGRRFFFNPRIEPESIKYLIAVTYWYIHRLVSDLEPGLLLATRSYVLVSFSEGKKKAFKAPMPNAQSPLR